MDWYETWLIAVLILWIGAAPGDRVALRIVLIASLFSEVFVELVTKQIPGAWKLIMPGAVEVATIASLLHWSGNRTAYIQAVLLMVAWLTHLLCYVDVWAKTDFVYSRYETIIQLIAVGQILAFHDTIFTAVASLRSAASHLRTRGAWGIRVGGGTSGVLPDTGSQKIQKSS